MGRTDNRFRADVSRDAKGRAGAPGHKRGTPRPPSGVGAARRSYLSRSGERFALHGRTEPSGLGSVSERDTHTQGACPLPCFTFGVKEARLVARGPKRGDPEPHLLSWSFATLQGDKPRWKKEETSPPKPRKMASIFSYQSAEVDWCEGNFEHSEYIAEYYNTISNLSFFVLAPLILWLNSPYASLRPLPVRCLALMEISIGLFSAYFHMTLSYAGQLLDELSILWGIAMCYAFWFPVRHFPGFVKNREQFVWVVLLVTLLSTLMSFVKPALNAYALNCFAFHLLYLTAQELRKCSNPRVHHLAAVMVIWWVVSIGCWLGDKFLCGWCQQLNFCYLHSLWHVFINATLLYCATLIIYFDVLYEAPAAEPRLLYWPSETSALALPYVAILKPQKWC